MKSDLDKSGTILEELAVVVGKSLETSLGLEGARAKEIGVSVALRFAENNGGQSVYIPIAISARTAIRDLEIRRKFNGRNAMDLAKEYKLTDMRIRQILNAPRKK